MAPSRADQERVEQARMGAVLERVHGRPSLNVQGWCSSSNSTRVSSHGDDLEEVIEADEVGGVARVQAGFVCMRRCCDQQVEHT